MTILKRGNRITLIVLISVFLILLAITSVQAQSPTEGERIARLEGSYEHLATKVDVENVRTEVEKVRTEVETVRTEVETVRTEVEKVRSEVVALRSEINGAKWFLSVAIGVAVILVGLINVFVTWQMTKPRSAQTQT